MAQWLRQNTAVKLMIGPAVATGGLTAVTTLKASTVTALRIRKHGATVVVSVSTANMFHVSGGHYYVPLTSVHTNTLGHLRLYVRASGTVKALPMWQDAHVVLANVFDSLVSGSTKLNVGTLSSGGAVWTATPRTLTSGAAVASSVWLRTTRLLTSGAAVASSVWLRSSRTLTSAGVAWDATLTAHQTNSTFGLAANPIQANTAASGTAGALKLVAGSSGLRPAGSILILVAGTGAGQSRRITAFTASTNQAAVAPNWSTNPNNTTKYTIWGFGSVTLLSGTHTGAIVPSVSTVSKLLSNSDKSGYSLATAGVVWTANARTLTSGAAVASSVWVRTTRTLTSGAAVASSVWARNVRTLTSGSAVASSVWVRTTRTLTSGSVVWTAVQAELAAVPAAGPAAGPALMFLYMSARNKRVTTASGDKVHNSATTVIATAPLTVGAATFIKSKYQ